MAFTLVLADGGLSSLVAVAAAAKTAALGPAGSFAACLLPTLPDSHPRLVAAIAHANLFSLPTETLRMPIEGPRAEDHLLLDAAQLVRERGGGELTWPQNSPSNAEGDIDVRHAATAMTRALLISQLVTLGSDGPPVRIRAPYIDLNDRQIIDLALDMELPIWTCWWMSASNTPAAEPPEEARTERAKWERLLKEAGWTGSLEARAAVRTVAKIDLTGGMR